MQQNTIGIGHQNFMLALRREMGWPTFKPANDCIAFCSGRRMDFTVGSEIARIAQMMRKDAVYTGWDSMKATTPLGFTIVFRELLTVDVVDRVVPFAANDDAPILDPGHSVLRLDQKPLSLPQVRQRPGAPLRRADRQRQHARGDPLAAAGGGPVRHRI